MSSAVRVKTRPRVTLPPPPAIPPLPVRRFTVDEYHRMIKAGILTDGEPFELIHGWIVERMMIYPPLSYAVNALMKFFVKSCPDNTTVRIQQPITTTDSEPEPDVVIAVGENADYAERHPIPSEVLLLVEVADTTLKKDQATKLELYAKTKIQVYWVVNLIDRRVEVYTDPNVGKKPVYKQHKDYTLNDSVPLIIKGKQVSLIPVKELIR